MQKRMDAELSNMTTSPLEGITINLDPQDNMKWTICVDGPIGTPYVGGKFIVLVTFPEQYPFQPPVFQFMTPIFHPNVTDKGVICQDMIGSKDWQPTRMVRSSLELIMNMMAAPNPDEPFNKVATEMFQQDKPKFEEVAKAETLKHAK